MFQNIELRVGWKVTGQEVTHDANGKNSKKAILVNWEERTIEDCFTDVRNFATNLTTLLYARLAKCVSHAGQLATFFDVEETAKLVCGERFGCGRVQIDEGQLEEHKFRIFFKEVCEVKHIKEAEDNRFDHRMSSSVLRDWKKGIRHLICLLWDKEMKATLFSCLAAVEKNTLPTGC